MLQLFALQREELVKLTVEHFALFLVEKESIDATTLLNLRQVLRSVEHPHYFFKSCVGARVLFQHELERIRLSLDCLLFRQDHFFRHEFSDILLEQFDTLALLEGLLSCRRTHQLALHLRTLRRKSLVAYPFLLRHLLFVVVFLHYLDTLREYLLAELQVLRKVANE